MAHIVVGEEQVRVPGAFQVGRLRYPGVVDVVLIAVQDLRFGTGEDGCRHVIEGVRIEGVVVIEEGDELIRLGLH